MKIEEEKWKWKNAEEGEGGREGKGRERSALSSARSSSVFLQSKGSKRVLTGRYHQCPKLHAKGKKGEKG